MENTKLDNTINNLRLRKPKLHDATLLTDSIMKQVTLSSNPSKPTFLIWIRTISSSAAVLLLGLLIYQQTNVTEIEADTAHTLLVEHNINIDSECIQNQDYSRTYLLKTYFCHMVSNSIKNQRLQSYYQQLNN